MNHVDTLSGFYEAFGTGTRIDTQVCHSRTLSGGKVTRFQQLVNTTGTQTVRVA